MKKVLDTMGEPCPYPFLLTVNELCSMKDGDILETKGDCPQTADKIISAAKKYGIEILEMNVTGTDWDFVLRVKHTDILENICCKLCFS